MVAWLAVLWSLTAIDGPRPRCLPGHPDQPLVCEYGIEPRDTGELVDIYPAAFLHFGFDHLIANSVPLLIFGFLAALRGIGRFLAVCLVIITVSGLGVWFTASSGSITAGASGVVFGLFGYLLVRGFVEKDAVDITIGITVFLLYGSLLWGVLPTNPGVSWQGHLFGLLGGILAAFWLRRSRAPRAPRGLSGPPPGHPG
ncbi:rhomboid family intramembrane serine protease [Streptomyces sp. ACA25]|uniref:rhomboid family intramembrane serine protease n=1 Tax=Streptomyces sp. ACA25 TaxID=3022596 RepID=UPI0023081A41|nr:rhomboid family intramembrane serine protease [Streptomyces sp. ACA25]MDB1090230.1 rhomboid family intramembrane serine protease [Streptomyces sp. ACA25]